MCVSFTPSCAKTVRGVSCTISSDAYVHRTARDALSRCRVTWMSGSVGSAATPEVLLAHGGNDDNDERETQEEE